MTHEAFDEYVRRPLLERLRDSKKNDSGFFWFMAIMISACVLVLSFAMGLTLLALE
jgi:hypothetical protein